MTHTKPAAPDMDGGFCVLRLFPVRPTIMPRLPEYGNAIVDLRKLQDYCLSPSHPRGRHKARVFREALGLTVRHAPWLRQTLIDGLSASEAEMQASDKLGTRWNVDIRVRRQETEVVVRTIWIVRTGERWPRFVHVG